MIDIVERLRAMAWLNTDNVANDQREAADEIERLRAEVERLRAENEMLCDELLRKGEP